MVGVAAAMAVADHFTVDAFIGRAIILGHVSLWAAGVWLPLLVLVILICAPLLALLGLLPTLG